MLFIFTIIKLLIILCIVASIHELGHFIAAKLMKIDVNEFSIGFGPKIFQKKYKETKYSLRWIPLGGYVSIEGEGEKSEKLGSYSNKSPIAKIFVLVMGVVFNIILAMFILVSISLFKPTYNNQIKELSQDSVLTSAGVIAGDKIVKINGLDIDIARDLTNKSFIESKTSNIEILRNSEIITFENVNTRKTIGVIGVAFKFEEGKVLNIVEDILPGSVADKADLKSGDKIIRINDIEMLNAENIINVVRNNPLKEVVFLIDRNGTEITKILVPETQDIFDLGINSTETINTTLPLAFENSINTVLTVAGSYADLLKGKVKIDEVSSIVGIGVVVSKTSGMVEYLSMLALISLAIGIANILPFPPLDGGKIVFVILNVIFRNKISEKVEGITSLVGFGLLILLTLVATFQDVMRIF